ncbi:hypothetical protein AB833_17995 [Chromatiales bacterium (ex Bugula neritina AB1)]|nr:hypothetical protein AB833_17995 [Chromatiales bacterium (ex Bugula neritina AB1)]
MITYQLDIRIPAAISIVVGRLGTFEFPAGRYFYTGSAKTNIEARIARHVRADKKLRWHIDYLLAHECVSIKKVERFAEPECAVNQRVNGSIVVDGFGSSDCRSGCGSHLKRLP